MLSRKKKPPMLLFCYSLTVKSPPSSDQTAATAAPMLISQLPSSHHPHFLPMRSRAVAAAAPGFIPTQTKLNAFGCSLIDKPDSKLSFPPAGSWTGGPTRVCNLCRTVTKQNLVRVFSSKVCMETE